MKNDYICEDIPLKRYCMEQLDKVVSESAEMNSGVENDMFTYKFRVKLNNGEDVNFSVPSKVIMMESPLKGYKSSNGTRPMLDVTNRLVYKPLENTVKRTVIIGVVALVVGLLIGAGIILILGKTTSLFEPAEVVAATSIAQFNEETQMKQAPAEDVKVVDAKAVEPVAADVKVQEAKSAETKVAEEKPAEAKPVDVNVMSAIRYLEDNDVWNRTAMEEYTALKGLWDALNTRSFKKVLDKKYDSLAGSAKFKRLRAAAKEVGTRQWPSSTYTSIGDEDITIDPYISKLERLLAPAN